MEIIHEDRLKLMIAEGEGLSVEFKEQYTSKIDRDMVAFANTKGGYILLGVADDSHLCGQTLDNKLKAEINSLARNCEPSISLDKVYSVGDVTVIAVDPGQEKPYSCSSGYFRRLDAVTQKMTHREVRNYFRESDAISFESLICRDLDFKDTSLTKLKAYFKEAGTSLKVNKANLPLVFSSLGVMDKNKISNAGALMFASEIKKVLPYVESIMGAFKGNDKTHIYDRKDVRDDLLSQFNEACAFLTKHLNIRSEIRGVNRRDTYEIPLEALREAVVNAIVHRDYSLKGTSIYIRVFDDRVEIENPGGLPSGVTMQSLGNSSVRRNPIIADLFHRMGKVERLGSGIDRMRDLMRNAGLKEPVFETDHFFRVIFGRNPLYSLKKGGTVEKSSEKGSEKGSEKSSEKSSEKILDAIRTDKNITTVRLAQQIGISRRAVEKQVTKLKAEHKLKRVGSDRSGYWEIISDK